MNVEELKQLLHEQNEGVLSTNIQEVIGSVMTLYEKGVEVGMEIGGQIRINQACEWIKKNRDELSRVNTSGFVELFKKAMGL